MALAVLADKAKTEAAAARKSARMYLSLSLPGRFISGEAAKRSRLGHHGSSPDCSAAARREQWPSLWRP
jgi:hypothetical protein